MPEHAPLCSHADFAVHATIVRIEDTQRFVAEMHVRCAVCGVRFRWLGLEMGVHPESPRTSVDGFELRAPIEPDGHLTSLMARGAVGFPSVLAKGRNVQ